MDKCSSKRCSKYRVYYAVSRSSVEELKELIKQGHSPDRSPAGCLPPLYQAVRLRRPDVALFLIQAGCNVKMPRRLEQHYSPIICIAADLSLTEVVLKLCTKPECDIFATNRDLRTIVHLAVMHKNYELIKGLITVHCSWHFLMLRDGICLTPLHLAARGGDVTMLKLLLKMNQFPDFQSTLAKCTSFRQIKCFHSLNYKTDKFQVTTDMSLNVQTAENQSFSMSPPPIPYSEQLNNILTYQSLSVCLPERVVFESERQSGYTDYANADSSASVNTDGRSNYLQSTWGTTTKQTERVVEADVNKTFLVDNGKLNSSRCNANVSGGESEIFSQVLQDKRYKDLIGQHVLGSKETMLHFAAREHHVDVIEFLINQGADVNTQNMMNNTPLHLLCMQGRADHRALAGAHLLLRAGADCNLKGSFRTSVRKSHLQRRGIDPSVNCTHKKVTVAMVAAIRNRVAFLKQLSEFGARYDAINAMHMTTLMLALRHGSEEAALYLLTKQPEKDLFHSWTDLNGNTALHYVSYCKHKAGQLTQIMLDQGYTVLTSQLGSVGYGSQIYSPVTWAICQGRMDVLEILVKNSPNLLLQTYEDLIHSPLHVAVRQMPGKECVPFLDYLLSHGSDGNAVVCGKTPFEFAVQGNIGVKEARISYAAKYLRQKLGASFLSLDYSHTHLDQMLEVTHHKQQHGVQLLPGKLTLQVGALKLREISLSLVRHLVREAKGDYYATVCSLPLPQSVIEALLFNSS